MADEYGITWRSEAGEMMAQTDFEFDSQDDAVIAAKRGPKNTTTKSGIEITHDYDSDRDGPLYAFIETEDETIESFQVPNPPNWAIP